MPGGTSNAAVLFVPPPPSPARLLGKAQRALQYLGSSPNKEEKKDVAKVGPTPQLKRSIVAGRSVETWQNSHGDRDRTFPAGRVTTADAVDGDLPLVLARTPATSEMVFSSSTGLESQKTLTWHNRENSLQLVEPQNRFVVNQQQNPFDCGLETSTPADTQTNLFGTSAREGDQVPELSRTNPLLDTPDANPMVLDREKSPNAMEVDQVHATVQSVTQGK